MNFSLNSMILAVGEIDRADGADLTVYQRADAAVLLWEQLKTRGELSTDDIDVVLRGVSGKVILRRKCEALKRAVEKG